jgi:hypothetical protein
VKGIAMRAPTWQKSSFSGMEADNNCLEMATLPHGPALRESEEPGLVLPTTRARLGALLTAVRADSFDVIRPGPQK